IFTERTLASLSLKKVKPGIYTDEAGTFIYIYVDDLIVFGAKATEIMAKISKKFKIGKQKEGHDDKWKFLGAQVQHSTKGWTISIKDYIQEKLQGVERPRGSLTARSISCGEEAEADTSLLPDLRKWLGILGWVARFNCK